MPQISYAFAEYADSFYLGRGIINVKWANPV